MKAVDLSYRYFGGEGKPPLIILHGLLGSSRNWTTVARDLTRSFEVFALDLRNHGDSPHDEAMTFEVMADDVELWLQRHELDCATVLGHSLGGKVAMLYACRRPARVSGLIVADIAPREYAPHHRGAFGALNSLDLAGLETRAEAEMAIQKAVPDFAFRRFLLTNLVREADEGFRWQINLPAITAALPALAKSPLLPTDRFSGSTLFLRGETSDFIREDDRLAMAMHFPRFALMTIRNAGHNLHVDNRKAFVAAVEYFAAQAEASDGGACRT